MTDKLTFESQYHYGCLRNETYMCNYVSMVIELQIEKKYRHCCIPRILLIYLFSKYFETFTEDGKIFTSVILLLQDFYAFLDLF